jgi:DNA replication protein DnaD
LHFAQQDYNEAVDNLVQHIDEPAAQDISQEGEQVTVGQQKFSDFKNTQGYNGRVLSKYRVDSMEMCVFNHKREFQELKMRSLTACLLKIDFNYKLTVKIRVWTKQGQSFSPYKCIVTVHNKDGSIGKL